MPTSSPLFKIHCNDVLSTLSYSGSKFCQNTIVISNFINNLGVTKSKNPRDTAQISSQNYIVLLLILQILSSCSLHKVSPFMLQAVLRITSIHQTKDYLKSQATFTALFSTLTLCKKKIFSHQAAITGNLLRVKLQRDPNCWKLLL